MSEPAAAHLRALVVGVASERGFDPFDIDDDTDLIELGIVDSLTLLEILSDVEDLAGAAMDDEVYDIANFRTLATMTALVARIVETQS